ncbi:hypothetical protein PF011_g19437 [Phytophthora fragariae]|uniref:Crinkler effector protein N-terminal domain-containing protein n=1 Tax=Phytophthora fragariae TaxID=53985 RepID=A0A6A3IXD3_9STRA|nr:hypothetical protein PF003_g8513 [Phytophthora fragariae]KAE8987789.1 hypothetical protein PF011_g19437 [Phytophthora fragariae]
MFDVKIDDAEKVSTFKKAIKDKNPKELKDVDANKLQLFLAKKKDGEWLLEKSDAAQKLEGGETNPEVMKMIAENKMMSSWTIQETLDDFKMTGELAPSSKQVHVLVVAAEPPPERWPPTHTTVLHEPEKFATDGHPHDYLA